MYFQHAHFNHNVMAVKISIEHVINHTNVYKRCKSNPLLKNYRPVSVFGLVLIDIGIPIWEIENRYITYMYIGISAFHKDSYIEEKNSSKLFL